MSEAAHAPSAGAALPVDSGTAGHDAPASGGLRWLVLAGVWLVYGAFGLVASSLAPLVANIVTDLGIGHAAMGSVLGAWQLVYIVSAIPCGMLLDRIGVRWAITIGALVIAASALTRGLADGYAALLVAVMLFGLGGPIVSAGAPKVIALWFTGPDRGFAMGVYLTGPAVGGIVSLTLTHSMLLPAFDGDWRMVMFAWCGIAVLAAAAWLAIASLPAARRLHAGDRLEIRAPQRRTIAELLASPAVRVVMLMSVGVFLFNHGLNSWLPELLRVGGMTKVEAGFWAAVPTVVGIIGSLTIPRLATPGRRFHILIALAACAAAATLLLHFVQPGLLFAGLFLQGVARSALMTVLILALVELPGIGKQHAGTASGLFFSAAEVGGVLGPLGIGALYDLTHGFDAGLWALTVVSVLIGAGALRLQFLVNVRERAIGSGGR